MKPNEDSELRFLERVLRYQENTLSPEELCELNDELRKDPERRAEFRRICGTSRLIVEVSESGAEDPVPGGGRVVSFPFRGTWAERAGIAALLLLSLGLVSLLWKEHGDEDWGDSVARLEVISGEAVFASDHEMARKEGSPLGKGWMRLEEGTIQLVFRSGAEVTLEGPAAFGIDSPMRSFLEYGEVAVYAPESARDFVVATEGMEVVDLGTRFEVGVDPQSGESQVSVLEGLVDLHLGSRGAERTIQPLEAGRAARVDAFGTLVEITEGPSPAEGRVQGTPGVLAHWPLDRVEPGEVIEDASGRGLEGIVGGEASLLSVPGVSDGALDFSEGAYVDLRGQVPAIGQLESFTLAAWVRNPSDPIAMIFSLSGETEQHRMQLYLARGFVRLGWQDGLHFDSISGRVEGWDPDRWYHVVVTVQDGMARLYRDGALVASGTAGGRLGTPVVVPSQVKEASHAYLGRLEDGRQGEGTFSQGFRGQLDDVQLYSGAISQEGIRFLFEHPGETF